MYEGLFQSTTIPVLEQVVNFSQARHTVLAGNIANMDTPGYRARDLSVETGSRVLLDAVAERLQHSVNVIDERRPCRDQRVS